VLVLIRRKCGRSRLECLLNTTMLEHFVENDEISFIEYMKAKGDAHYLEKQPDWLKRWYQILPLDVIMVYIDLLSKISRLSTYDVSRNTQRNRLFVENR